MATPPGILRGSLPAFICSHLLAAECFCSPITHLYIGSNIDRAKVHIQLTVRCLIEDQTSAAAPAVLLGTVPQKLIASN